MFQTPTRKGFSVTPRVNFNKNKEKMSAPNNAEYYLRKASAGLPNSVLLHPGSMIMWPSTTAPDDWKLCDGVAISRTTFSDLFDEIGTTYGAGDGSTTFNLPNLKGKVAVGLDSADADFDALGETGGESTHVLTVGEMPQHNHGILDSGHTHATLGGGRFITSKTSSGVTTSIGSNLNTGQDNTTKSSTTGITTSQAGSDDAHENKQPYLVINFIIKT